MRCFLFGILAFSIMTAGCSSLSPKKPAASVYAAGDKATVGPLVYTVTDTEIVQQLGDDPGSARTPQHRFYLVRVSVSNSSSEDQSIPSMTLVDDDGNNYPELADGTNVQNWLGVIRKVSSAQTEQGNVIFDAPAKHYRLRLTDPLDEKEISIDVPLSFAHEQIKDISGAAAGAVGDPTPPAKK